MSTELKQFDFIDDGQIEKIASHLLKTKEKLPKIENFGAVYAIKNHFSKVVYIGKSDSYFGAIARVITHMKSRKCFFTYSIASVPFADLDLVERKLIEFFQPQYNIALNPRIPNMEDIVATAIYKCPNHFTLQNVMSKLAEMFPDKEFKKESVCAAMSKVKKDKSMFVTFEKMSGPNRCAIYEKTT